jgi:hypothetical protein
LAAGATDVTEPTTAITASFRPERLGADAAVSFAISVAPPPWGQLVPVSELEVSYPEDLGLATSGLGLQPCPLETLTLDDGEACPANSRMGRGSARVEVPFGPRLVPELVALEIYAAPSSDGYLHLAILANGGEPVIAQALLSAVLLPGLLKVQVPSVETLPGAPDAALVEMHATLGGPLTYYERVRGHVVAYRPRGIGLPDSCPRGGWTLGASLVFSDGAHSHAETAIRCPHRARKLRG